MSGHDSAGLPWEGRRLPVGDFAGDDGQADPPLCQALQGLLAGAGDEQVVVRALAAARVFVPVVAVRGEGPVTGPSAGHDAGRQGTVPDAGSRRGDPQADLALATLTGPDGRRALPVFASIAALARWDDAARPVPVPARRAALSAVAEGCELLVLDPAGPITFVASRAALWAIGAGRDWQPAHEDAQVRAELDRAVEPESDVLGVRASPGRTAELLVTLELRAGLSQEEVGALAARVSELLQGSDVVRERVDGLELSIQPADPTHSDPTHSDPTHS